MCTAKPKVPKAPKPKDPAIIRNPYLDGSDPLFRSLRLGRSALRIERTGVAGSAPPPVTAPTGPAPAPAPVNGGSTPVGAIKRPGKFVRGMSNFVKNN